MSCSGKKKKTNEQFTSEVTKLFGSEYKFIDDYINATTPIRVIHTNCGRVYKVKPMSFIQRQAICQECSIRTKSVEEYSHEVDDLTNGKFIVTGVYKGSDKPIEITHTTCGTKFDRRASSFLGNPTCPSCKNKETNKGKEEQFLSSLDAYSSEIEALEDFANLTTKISVKHKCGEIYKITPCKLIDGNVEVCPYCNNVAARPYDFIIKEIEDAGNGEYSFVKKTKIRGTRAVVLRHDECGSELLATYRNFVEKGVRCHTCVNKKVKSTGFFKEQVHDLVGDEYSVVGDYVRALEKIEFTHNGCGRSFFMRPNSFLSGIRCPLCSASKGEHIVEQALIELGIAYSCQYIDDRCMNKRHLPFDFAVYSNSGDLRLLIEYDGLQHFEPVKFFGGEKRFADRQINDGIKNEFCKSNNIPLLRIPYWKKDDVPEIISMLNSSEETEDEDLLALFK